MKTFCAKWSGAVGSIDAMTGIALLLSPGFVLGALQIEDVPEVSFVFIRWVGIFVGSVGLSYLWAMRGGKEAEVIWGYTGMVRAFVAVFVTSNILLGNLETAWAGVAATDGFIAVVQFIGLKKRWWR